MELRNVCRTCLLPGESMLSIFDLVQVPIMEPNKIPILDLLKLFTEISVFPNDGLPDHICGNCLGQIYQTYSFKLNYQKSAFILKQLKEDGKSVMGLINFPNQYEHDFGLIKIENTDYETSNNNQLEQNGLPPFVWHSVTHQELALAQQVKQEPEIEINMEEDFNAHEECPNNDSQCPICSKIYKYKHTLEDHMKNHTIEIPLQCEVCSQKFRYRKDLNNHSRLEHGNKTLNTLKYKCTLCPKMFSRKNSLIEHMRVHTGKQTFECEICSNKFCVERNLISHMQRKHTDCTTNNYKCRICSKLFCSTNSLNQHMRIHIEDRPFQCEGCPKRFRLKHHLLSHMEAKHCVEPFASRFKCAICGTSFNRKSSLNEHMKIHTGLKTFQCEFCQNKFLGTNDFKHHMESTHFKSIILVDQRSRKERNCTSNRVGSTILSV